MSKEEILERLEVLEREAIEIRAEQEYIENTLDLVNGGKLDAVMSHLMKMKIAVEARINKWNNECDMLEAEVNKIAA